MTAITDKNFIDWENHVFGYGYGSGEEHIMEGIKQLFSLLDSENYAYSSSELEISMGPLPTWLLINVLSHADILEYGTSPRYGWLTHDKGVALKHYMDGKSANELSHLCASTDGNYDYCEPAYCNCAEGPCSNPLFGKNINREWTQRPRETK